MKTMLIAFDFDLDSRGIICYKIIANVISCLNLAYKYKGEKWAGRAEKRISVRLLIIYFVHVNV